MRDIAAEFLTEIFRPSRLETPPFLRGVYFTSGTQDGTPIDRLLGAMAGQFGLQRQAVTAFSGAGRSYFLTRLLREVVFNEAGLVSQDERLERRARWTYRGAYAAAAVVLLLATAGWASSYIGNREMIDEVHGSVEHYNTQLAELTRRGPDDVDLMAVLPALNTLRLIRGGYEQRAQSTPIELTFGLYQGNKLTTASIDAYYRALNALLLPRLLNRLETQLQANLDKPDFLYEALKVYLVLGRQGPIDHDQVMAWLITDFTANFPGDEQEADRDALLAHADAMLQRPLTAIPLNGPLVKQVRDILNREPLANYSYNRIMHSPRIQALPDWTVADNGGPESVNVFTLRSGKPLTSGLPGIFTWQGYHEVFLPLLPTVTQDIAEDGWVLGRDKKSGVAGALAAAGEINKLRRDVIGLYLDDYVIRWDALLADIALRRFTTLAEANAELGKLSAPASPLRTLLEAIDGQTQLSHKAATDALAGKGEQTAARVGTRLAGFGKFMAFSNLSYNDTQIVGILGEAFGNTPGTNTPIDPATRVDDHFRAFHNFVAGAKDTPPPAPMEVVIAKIGALAQGFNQAANAANPLDALTKMAAGGGGGAGGGAGGGGGGGGAPPAQQLQDLAKDLPKPVAAMLTAVTQSSGAVVSGGASKGLQDAWAAKVLPLCQAAFNRYPFVAGSSDDVPIDDFTHLLGPGGLMDQFFADNLKSFIDTTSKPWKWQAANHAQLALANETLVEFERAAQIRDSLFSSGGQQIVVKFQLVPVSLDPQIAQISLDIAGQTLTYNHGPTESMAFQWPSTAGKTLVRETVTPTTGQASEVDKDGPWALLRLLDTAKVQPSGQPDKFRLVFVAPAGAATFDLNASSVHNPFTLSALRAFRCPPTL
jgi:type VI secretion system protein ImpL